MLPEHVKILSQRDLPVDVQELFERCHQLIEMSRDRMSAYYERWDFNDNLAKNRIISDDADKRASERKEPRKMVVPLTSSQIDTFVSFAYTLITQREKIYELEGTSAEDHKGAVIGSSLLERDLSKSNFRGHVLQNALTNCTKFNLGVLKHAWERESIFEEVEISTPTMGAFGMTPIVSTQRQEKVTFEGNRVLSISPYKFFPDPRFPLSRLQEGEFCGDECEHSKMRLERLQAQGVIAGLEFVDAYTADTVSTRRIGLRDAGGEHLKNLGEYLQDNFILTEIQLELIPKNTMFGGKPLGPEDTPIKYVIWYLNDQRIVRVEPLSYGHSNFLYRALQYMTDETEYIGPSLPDMIEKLQEAISWFINARITSVRKVIDNKLIVDPRGIDIKSLKNRDPILLLKPAAQGGDVRRWVQQLNVQDVTANHLADVQALTAFAKETTGLSENIQGQFSPGRRSAREAGIVNNNAASRAKRLVDAIWYSALQPLGEDMLANHRSWLSAPQLVKVIGTANLMFDPGMSMAATQFLQVSREDIAGNYDFVIYDGTLPSEKMANADGLQGLLEMVFGAPEFFMQLGYNPQILHELMIELLTLRGVKNVRYYQFLNQITQQLGQLGPGGVAQPGAPVSPADQQPGLPAPAGGTPA